MPRFYKLLSLALLIVSFTACTATPEYPGFKTNVKIGQSQKMIQKNPARTAPSSSGLIHTEETSKGDNAVCVGAWCSCQTE